MEEMDPRYIDLYERLKEPLGGETARALVLALPARTDVVTKEDFRDLAQRIDGFTSSLGARIDGVEASLGARIDGVEASLGARIDGVEASLGARIDNVETSLGARIDGVDARVDGLESSLGHRIDALDGKLGGFRSEYRFLFSVLGLWIGVVVILAGYLTRV